MGLYDLIKKREKLKKISKLPNGKQVLTETKEKFLDFCESLTKDFRGVMRLYGKLNGKLYIAGLLLEKGNVIAASFEDVDNEKIIFKEEAISQIKERLSGTKGDLEVYAFNDRDMKKASEGNKEALLISPVPFSSLGMRIRSKIETWAKKTSPESFARGEKPEIKELKTEEGFNLADFAHKFPEIFSSRKGERLELKKVQLKKEEIPEEKEVVSIDLSKIKESLKEVSDLKKEKLNELKRKRQIEDIALRKKISKITGKGYRETVRDTCKIETSIDKLYQLIQEHNRLKIDNRLVRRLGVSRSQIESWAMILEEHNLVELHYPAIGEPEIRKIKGKV